MEIHPFLVVVENAANIAGLWLTNQLSADVGN